MAYVFSYTLMVAFIILSWIYGILCTLLSQIMSNLQKRCVAALSITVIMGIFESLYNLTVTAGITQSVSCRDPITSFDGM